MEEGNIYVLEGSIAVGKSTLGLSLSHYLQQQGKKVIFFPENCHPQLLSLYLNNKKEYAFLFQMIMMKERIHTFDLSRTLANDGYIVIIDRGLLGDFVFARMQYEKGFFIQEEWEVYLSYLFGNSSFSHFYQQYPINIIFLDVDPQIAFRRLIQRGNQNEIKSYDLEYFYRLQNTYLKVIQEIGGKNVCLVKWDEDKNIVSGKISSETCQIFLSNLKK